MSELVTMDEKAITARLTEQWSILKSQICPTATDAELKFFIAYCAAKKLDPIADQVCLIKRKTKNGAIAKPFTTISGLRALAARTGQYAGSDKAVFKYKGGGNVPEKRLEEPVSAEVTVYKLIGGQRVPFTHEAYWDEYYPGGEMGFMYRSKPRTMLGKCAEAQALRKAFPEECGGIYCEEESASFTGSDPIKVESEATDLDQHFGLIDAPKEKPAPSAIEAQSVDMASADQIKLIMETFSRLGVSEREVLDICLVEDASEITQADVVILRQRAREIMTQQRGDKKGEK